MVTSVVLEPGFFGSWLQPRTFNWVTLGKGIHLSVEEGQHRTFLKGFLRA